MRLDRFHLARGLQVHVEDEVVAGVQPPRHRLRLHQRGRVRLPEKEVRIRVKALARVDRDVHARDAALPVVRVRAAQCLCAVQNHVGVVHHARRTRLDLHRSNPLRRCEGGGQHEVAEDIRAGCRHVRWRRDGEHQVRLPKLPLGGIDRRLGRIGSIPLRHARRDPLLDRCDVCLGQAARILEVAMARLRQPGWHVTRCRDLLHQRAPALRVAIGHKRERAGAALVMAGRAVLVDDWRYVVRPRHGSLCGTDRRWPAARA